MSRPSRNALTILFILVLFVAAGISILAGLPADAVETKTQADYERAICIGSQLPECRSYQVAEK